MDEARIKVLLEEAAGLYNDGRYDEAIASWHQVLALEPSNQKAREGIRMASLLMTDTDNSEVQPGEDEAAVLSRIEAGISRVRELAASGQYTEAVEGCNLLAEIAPHHAQVRQLGHEIRLAARQKGAPAIPAATAAAGHDDLEHHLETARLALADGLDLAAAEAARSALSIDPANMEACGILSLVDGDTSQAAPLEIGSALSETIAGYDLDEEPAAPDPDFSSEPADSHSDTQPQQAGTVAAVTGKVLTLLESGQRALEAGRFQEAVDIWSRVYAVDLTNAEAGRRIDVAKAALEEQAREIDHLYYQAVDANEANKLEEALALFEQVLAISPSHIEARAFVDEITLRLGGLGEPIQVNREAVKEIEEEKIKRAPAKETSFEGVESVPLARPVANSPYPPRASAGPRMEARPAAAAEPAVSSRGGKSGRMVAGMVGVLVIAGVGIGAWLWIGSDSGSMPEAHATVLATAPQAAPSRPVVTPRAVAAPQTAAPIEVVPGEAAKKPEPTPQKVDLETLRRQAAELEAQGRHYFQQRKWAEAVMAFRKSMTGDPVGFDAQELLDKAMAELEQQAKIEREMDHAVKALKQNDYATALQKFYRMQQDNPGMKNLDTCILNTWFNWGVSLLADGEPDEAAERFKEVLDIDASDREAAKASEVAKRYHGRQRDAVYQAFVSSLKPRALDQN